MILTKPRVPTNVAHGCACRQSSVNQQEQGDPDGASAAVNGIKTGRATFTTQKEDAPWWQIDLGQVAELDSVVIYNWDLTGLPYSAAGRGRARYLQIWGSADALDWHLLHDRRRDDAGHLDFGGINNGPLCVPLAPARYRHMRLGLAGGGILQLDQVLVYAVQERALDDALREMLECARDLSFAMARRIFAALDLPAHDLPDHLQRLGIELAGFATVFISTLLVEQHQGSAARTLLGVPAPAPAPPAFLSIHLPPYPLPADGDIACILQGKQARLLRAGEYADGAALQNAVAALFIRHPRLEQIVAADIAQAWAASVPDARIDSSRAVRLDLPASFSEYQLSYLAPQLLATIGGEDALSLTVTDAASLDDAAYQQALQAACASDPAVLEQDWGVLRPYARLASLHDPSHTVASAVYLDFAPQCHLRACSGQSAAAANSLQARLIGRLIGHGYRHVVFSGRDLVNSIQFGALEQPVHTLTFRRAGEQTMRERIQAAMESGRSPGQIEAGAGLSLETMLGKEFEPLMRIDFDAIVENAELGTDSNARRYQPTIRDAFFMMMKHVPFDAAEVFVDVGSGKGKMLYYAHQLGYRKCLGMEISPMLQQQAKINFERLRLPVDIRLWERWDPLESTCRHASLSIL